MDKAIIIGVYDYLGFHLCLKFLEEGMEVIGVDSERDEIDIFLEEKKLSIGRNSNFAEMDVSALKQGNGPIFIDYYSSYLRGEETRLISLLNKLTGAEGTSIVVLLPMQMCEKRSEEEHSFFQTLATERKSNSSFFYLPSIYGPWQPFVFALQQSLYEPDKEIVVNEREWTKDALYIDDAITAITSHFATGGEKNIALRSMIEDHWQKIMGNAKVEQRETKSVFREDLDLLFVNAGKTEPMEGVRKQKEHLFTILRGMDI